MIQNYLKTALRNLGRNKAFSAINVIGLCLGLACSLLIFLWVKDELNVDAFNARSSQLYKIYERQYTGGKIKVQPNTPGIMADEMKRVLPQVEYACAFANIKAITINTFEAGNKILKEEGAYAGADFFKMFNYRMTAGDAASALNTPVDIAVSRKMAVDFFGTVENAMGKTLRLNDKKDLQVAAVFETPHNASTKFEYLINWQTFLDQFPGMKSWGNTGVSTYVLLKTGTNPIGFEKQLLRFLDKYDPPDPGYRVELGMQRFDELYLHSNFNSMGQPEGGRIEYVRLFSIVAIFILLIACINFMNLTTARSIKRAKEIGVRKVVGALRSSLIGQFIGEAILMTFISIAAALALVVLILPVFNTITQKQISFPLYDASFWLTIVMITSITGIISGSYPALFLSSFNPVTVLKGTLKLKGVNTVFRQGLVVFQFVLAIVLIVGTIVVSRQVNYIQTKNLGYSRENLIYIPQEGELGRNYTVFKDEALKMPGIKSVSRTGQEPTNITSSTSGIDWEGKAANSKPTFGNAGVGYDFIKTMDLQLAQGRDFSRDFATDSAGFILNEEAVKMTGYKDPIGKSFTLWGRKGNIIGVVKDFHFNSLHVPVNAMVMYLNEKDERGTILVKTMPGETKAALTGLKTLYKQLNPKFPFTYEFADEEYSKLYMSEQMVGKLSNYFAFLAISISCLGLLGLAMFTAEQRIKEIGIRKVLGATVTDIAGLLSRDFLKLVLIAAFIAFPIAWWAVNSWLQNFQYKITVGWQTFALAGFAAIMIALVTVSFQAIKAAIANPIKSLRTE
jgi:ABC-type antimicrobial peptide transport system permease subunit